MKHDEKETRSYKDFCQVSQNSRTHLKARLFYYRKILALAKKDRHLNEYTTFVKTSTDKCPRKTN